ncbi:MAG: hypothetical protein ACRBCT_04670 [Alphaproteobacteria bacterium]
MSHMVNDFAAAGSIALRATFNNEGQHLDTFATSINGQSLDSGLNLSADPAMAAKLDIPTL